MEDSTRKHGKQTWETPQSTNMEDSASEAGSAEDQAVFMCASCRLPFGDSRDLQICSDENLILLRGVTTNVEINTTKAVSPFKLDYYSAVRSLFCKGCSAVIGILYTATPRHLEYKRGLFSLNKCAITCYSFNHTSKQRVRQEPAYHPTVSHVDTQLKKVQTVLGDCTRLLSVLEHTVN